MGKARQGDDPRADQFSDEIDLEADPSIKPIQGSAPLEEPQTEPLCGGRQGVLPKKSLSCL